MAFVLPDELHLVIRWLGGNFFLICTKRPDNLQPFARRGKLSRDWEGVYHPPIPPGSFSPDWKTDKEKAFAGRKRYVDISYQIC